MKRVLIPAIVAWWLFVVTLAVMGKHADRRIIWNPATGELSWSSSTDASERYVAGIHKRTLTLNGRETRRISESEALAVSRLLMQIENYTMESEDGGSGEKSIEKQPPCAAGVKP